MCLVHGQSHHSGQLKMSLRSIHSIQFRGTLQNKRHLECLSPRVLGTSYETSFTLGNGDGVGRERVRRKEYFWVFPCVSSKQAQAKDHLFAQASIYLSHRTHFLLHPPPLQLKLKNGITKLLTFERTLHFQKNTHSC